MLILWHRNLILPHIVTITVPSGYQWGGVKIPRIEQEYFAAINGIKSEFYVPFGVYYYLINPYLNRWPFRRAYEDKNAFHVHLQLGLLDEDVKIRFPYMVFNRVNGKYYINGLHYATEIEAIQSLVVFGKDVIVKPTFDTWGNGVMKIKSNDINEDTLSMLNKKYGLNYTVQECVKQHPAMATFNQTSVNTVRVMTYFNSKGEYECLRTIQRFGGEGAVVDNACAGGGFWESTRLIELSKGMNKVSRVLLIQNAVTPSRRTGIKCHKGNTIIRHDRKGNFGIT